MKINWIIVSVLFLLLFGCDNREREADLKSYLIDLKAKIIKKNKENPPLAIDFPVAVTYQSKTMRTPFQPALSASTANSAAELPLQSFPLNALRFLGTIQEGNQMLAVVQTPNDIVYQVKIGDIIGKQYGKIIKIYPDKLEVMEKVPEDGSTTAKYRIVTMQLRDAT